jgi:hypothetical protein
VFEKVVFVSRTSFSLYSLFCGLVRAVEVTMEGRDLLIKDSVEDKEEGAVEIVIERAFVVNELVEFMGRVVCEGVQDG